MKRLLLCLVLSWLVAPVVTAQQKRCLNIAHRGGGRLAPESTLAAFRKAIAAGADVLELDLHATADGVIVVSHDRKVDRMTNGRGLIGKMSHAELLELDAGHRFTRDGGRSFPYRAKGLTIPSFEKVLEAFPKIQLIVEIKQSKPSIVDRVIALLKAADANKRVILASSKAGTLREIRRKAPTIRTSFGPGEIMRFMMLGRDGEAKYKPPGQVLMVPGGLASAAFMARARRLKLEVHVFTINDAKKMQSLIAAGVDGIMTDDPARLKKVLEADD